MEEALIYEGIRKGEKKAFESAFRVHYAALCGYALKYLQDRDQCEEIVQDFFCHLWEIRDTLNIKSSFSSYLFSSVRNRCLNEIRNAKVRLKHIQDEVATQPNVHHDQTLETIEMDQAIEDAIEKLPEMSKKVFLMSRTDGLKYKEIAEKLGISVKAVEANMSRALSNLKKDLKIYMVDILILMMMCIG